MSSDNLPICKFLSYYCQLKSPPEYAVLIKGVWGIGKTKFVHDILEELKERGQEHLYVSLYGVTSIDDIEGDFFRQIHPWLTSKGAKLIGKLTKGLIKAAFKLDFDGDGQSDATITAGVPTEKLLDSFKVAEGKLLVFDDLERCAIPISNLLGYINQFVEHFGFKVILIANEEEILRRENKKEKETESKSISGEYLRIKEKLIGKTFEIKPEIEDAFNNFGTLLQCTSAKSSIEENKELVINLFSFSNYKNLRILRHALLELDRIFSNLSEKVTENRELVSHFLTLYLVYSFETRSGAISPQEISKFRMIPYFPYLQEEKDKHNPNKKYIDISSKYTGIDLNDTIFDDSIWHSMFDEGFVNFKRIEEAVANSKYFSSETQPNWARLCHGTTLSDPDFESVLKKVEVEWLNMCYKEIGVVKHVAGLLFWLSDLGIYRENKNDILLSSKKYVDHLKKQGYLLKGRMELFEPEPNVWGGLAFHAWDDNKFQELLKYISDKENEAVIESYPAEASALLQSMKDETERFFRSMVSCSSEDSRFYEVPIFTYIKPSDFVKVFLELTPEQRKTVSYIFKDRYKYNEYNAELVDEIPFLKEVIRLLERAKIERHGKMSGYTIGLIVDQYIKKAVATLED